MEAGGEILLFVSMIRVAAVFLGALDRLFGWEKEAEGEIRETFGGVRQSHGGKRKKREGENSSGRTPEKKGEGCERAKVKTAKKENETHEMAIKIKCT